MMEYVGYHMITPKKDLLARFRNSLILAQLFDALRLAIILTTLFSIIVMGHYFFVENQQEKQLQNEISSLSSFYKRHDLTKLTTQIGQKNSTSTTFKYQLINKQGMVLAGKPNEKTLFHDGSVTYEEIRRALDNTDILIVKTHKSTNFFNKTMSSILNFFLITSLVLIVLSLADLFFQRHTYD